MEISGRRGRYGPVPLGGSESKANELGINPLGVDDLPRDGMVITQNRGPAWTGEGRITQDIKSLMRGEHGSQAKQSQ